jgi:DNA (cytosine-5)-methyltransferase 1
MAIGQTGGGNRIRSADDPVNTQVSKAESCLVAPTIIQYHTEKKNERVRGQSLDDTLMTVDAANRYGLASAQLTEYFGNGQAICVNDPMHTVTARDRENMTLAHLSKFYGGVTGAPMEQPVPTVTAFDHNALTAAFVSKFYKTGTGQDIFEPLHTCTTSEGHFGLVYTTIIKAESDVDLHHWPEIRTLLNEYCGYQLADDEVLLLWIDGIAYFIADIGLRMLTSRELYAAQGFPSDYIIDHDYLGNQYPKSKQVARCGNAVPPPFAEALVRANLPEYASEKSRTMAELIDKMAM